jgi:hypothetical protein
MSWSKVGNIRGPQGVPGPKGDPGSDFLIHEQTTPAATWTVPHALGRYPLVQLVVGGAVVLTDVEVDSTQAVAIWPQPVAGTMILA